MARLWPAENGLLMRWANTTILKLTLMGLTPPARLKSWGDCLVFQLQEGCRAHVLGDVLPPGVDLHLHVLGNVDLDQSAGGVVKQGGPLGFGTLDLEVDRRVGV